MYHVVKWSPPSHTHTHHTQVDPSLLSHGAIPPLETRNGRDQQDEEEETASDETLEHIVDSFVESLELKTAEQAS